MANDIVELKTNLPASYLDHFAGETENLISSSGGFPVLSIRGSKFRVRHGGEEKPLVNAETGDPVPSIEVVILKAGEGLSKIFYKKKYEQGDDAPPDCFSSDGITPDVGAMNKQASSCAACPNAVWGSRITDTGTKAKACSDSKRLAVTFTSNMENIELGGPMLLRVPADSLRDLTRFGKELMQKHHMPMQVVSARIGFDIESSHPKLTFKAVRPLTRSEVEKVVELHANQQVNDIVVTMADVAPPPAKRQQSVDTDFEANPEPAANMALGEDKPATTAKPRSGAKSSRVAKPAKKADDSAETTLDGLSELMGALEG